MTIAKSGLPQSEAFDSIDRFVRNVLNQKRIDKPDQLSSFRPSLLTFFLRRVHDRNEAEDLVQDVFLRLSRRGELSRVSNLPAYIFETASSVLRDRARRRRARAADAHDEFDFDHRDEAGFSPDRVVDGRQRLRQASAILLELPERTRHIFVLRRMEGLRYQDIASRLGISVSAVEKHMQRAVAHLIQRLDDE